MEIEIFNLLILELIASSRIFSSKLTFMVFLLDFKISIAETP
jgi:hypothetical protein